MSGKAWIFGKGPTLTKFLDSGQKADGYSIGINQAAFIVPCDAFIALDSFVFYMPAKWPTGMRAIVPRMFEYQLPESCTDRFLFTAFKQHENHLTPVANRMQYGLLYRDTMTLSSAIYYAVGVGYEQIIFCGIDGGGGYTFPFANWASSDDHYQKGKEAGLLLAQKLGVRVEEWRP